VDTVTQNDTSTTRQIVTDAEAGYLRRWYGPKASEPSQADAQTFVALLDTRMELSYALARALTLASVANEGDPWFAEDAGIDAEDVLRTGRALLARLRSEASMTQNMDFMQEGPRT
jgi:hypothetical protein